MKKFLLSLFVIFLAYLTAYYTSGADEKQELFELGDSPMLYKIKCAITGETDTTDANDLYYRAIEHYDRQEYENAIKDYKSALRIDPDMTYSRIDMADAYLAMNDTAGAMVCYMEHMNDSDYPEDAYNKVGQLYKMKGNLDSALHYYNLALKNNTENDKAFYNIARLYFDNENLNKALENANKAIDIYAEDNYSDNLDYRNLRRRIYLKQGKKNLAEEEYYFIQASDPYYFPDYAAKAKQAEADEEYQAAIEYYKLALENAPENIEWLNAKAWIYNNTTVYDSALMDFKRVLHISPDYLSYFNVAYMYGILDSLYLAITNYSSSIQLDKTYHLSYNNRGAMYYRKGDYKKAEEDYSTCIQLKEDYYLAYQNRGILYNEKKKYTKAIIDYKKAMNYTSNNKLIVYDIALIYDKVKNKKEAARYFRMFVNKAEEADSVKTNYANQRLQKLGY